MLTRTAILTGSTNRRALSPILSRFRTFYSIVSSLKIRQKMGGSLAVVISGLLLLLTVGVAAGGCRQTASSASGSLHVQVVAPDDNGLAGAKVVSNIQPGAQLKVTGITGADGVVAFAGLKPGSYEFYVSRFDYDQKSFLATVLGDTTASIKVTLSVAVR